MAQVTVRVKIDKEFEVTCEGTDADSCIENILDYDRINDDVIDLLADSLKVTAGTYNEPEEDEEDDDEDN